MFKRLVLVSVSVAMLGLVASAGAQEDGAAKRAAIAKALQRYMQAAAAAETEAHPGAPAKVVPRTDKAETIIIGALDFVDVEDVLDDGTPFRIVGVYAKRPFDQDVFVVCLGASMSSQCNRYAPGKRLQFTADVLIVEDGDSAGLALLIAKKLKV